VGETGGFSEEEQAVGGILESLGLNGPVFFAQLISFVILLFALGTVAHRGDWLMRIPYAFGMRWFRISLFGGGAAWVLLIGAGGGAANLQAYTGG
jgi:hypothetical protein